MLDGEGIVADDLAGTVLLLTIGSRPSAKSQRTMLSTSKPRANT
jgi:hypothetical protein